jgi:hypothetical protein
MLRGESCLQHRRILLQWNDHADFVPGCFDTAFNGAPAAQFGAVCLETVAQFAGTSQQCRVSFSVISAQPATIDEWLRAKYAAEQTDRDQYQGQNPDDTNVFARD